MEYSAIYFTILFPKIEAHNYITTMKLQYPSVSAVGEHFDEEVEIAARAHHYYEEEGRPEGRALEHWMRASEEVHGAAPPPDSKAGETPPSGADVQTEELMHRDQ